MEWNPNLFPVALRGLVWIFVRKSMQFFNKTCDDLRPCTCKWLYKQSFIEIHARWSFTDNEVYIAHSLPQSWDSLGVETL